MKPVHLDAGTADCLVFTYKAGLLASVGHDLKLRVAEFAIEADGAGVRARFEASSLRVVCAQVRGEDDLRALSDRDRREIEATIVKDVLDARRHPAIEFRAKPIPEDAEEIPGTLSLRGREAPVSARLRHEGGLLVAEAVVHQPAFGIRPYTAMLGALRVQPDVRIRITMPRPQ